MAKSKTVYRYVAVMRDKDSGDVSRLKAVVARLKGSVTKVEEKVLKGVVHTGVGIEIGGAGAKSLNGAIDPCWTLYARGTVDTPPNHALAGGTGSPKGAGGTTTPPSAPPPENAKKRASSADDDEGYNTGDPELDEYLQQAEDGGCSYGEISLMIPTSAKPSEAFVRDGGYYCFHRGECKSGNPRLPKEVAT